MKGASVVALPSAQESLPLSREELRLSQASGGALCGHRHMGVEGDGDRVGLSVGHIVGWGLGTDFVNTYAIC